MKWAIAFAGFVAGCMTIAISVRAAGAAPPDGAASGAIGPLTPTSTTDQPEIVVDLRQFPAPTGATFRLKTAATLELGAKLPPAGAVEFYRQALIEAGWKPIDSSRKATGESSFRVLFEQGPSTLSLSVAQGTSPGESRVVLRDRGDLDTRQLPRAPGSELLTGSRPVTAFACRKPAEDVAQHVTRALIASGWRRYKEADPPAPQTGARLLYFRQARDGLTVSIAAPTARESATRVSYSVRRFAHPTPTPPDATDVEIDDARWEVRCRSAADISAVADFYRQSLAVAGFRLARGAGTKPDERLLRFDREDGSEILVDLAATREATTVSLQGFSADQLAKRPTATLTKPAADETARPPIYVQDLPLPAGAQQVKYARQTEEISFTSSRPFDDVVKELRAKLSAAGWLEKSDGSLLAEGAGIVEFHQGDSSLIIMLDEMGRGAGTQATITAKGMAWR